MPFEKRVCVLKQIKKGFTADGSALSGAIYAERMGTELVVTPRMIGIAPVRDGRYAIALRADGRDLLLEWRGEASLRVTDAPSVKQGFAALVVFLKGEAEAVAFGSCGACDATPAAMLEGVRMVKNGKKKLPDPLPPVELPAPFSPNNVPKAPTVPLPGEEEPRPFREQAAAYDDEAIADANYFRPDEDDAHAGDAGGADGPQDLGAGQDDQTSDLFARPRGQLTYYERVREKIEEAFCRFPEDERLKSVFPNSRWVKAEGALLGVVYGEGVPKYLCVATEGVPPEEAERACFVPLSPYSETEGMYVIFQSAETGEYVTVSPL